MIRQSTKEILSQSKPFLSIQIDVRFSWLAAERSWKLCHARFRTNVQDRDEVYVRTEASVGVGRPWIRNIAAVWYGRKSSFSRAWLVWPSPDYLHIHWILRTVCFPETRCNHSLSVDEDLEFV